MSYFVHQHAICESDHIGEGTRIWAFAHVLPQAVIGRSCNICDGVFIENDVVVGDNVTIKCGVQLWDGIRLMDNVFVGPNATFANDIFPRSTQYPERFLTTTVEKGASIGANATILPGITVGMEAMVGAGAVVIKDVPPKAIVVGNPSRIVGYVGTDRISVGQEHDMIREQQRAAIAVGNAELWRLKRFEDMRGSLMVNEFTSDLPFIPKRTFFVYDVPSEDVRGEHAHRECAQFLICLKGSVRVVLDDGCRNKEVLLDSPEKGLYMPPMIWGIQYKFSEDAMLLVYASHPYNNNEYIRNYADFIASKRGAEPGSN